LAGQQFSDARTDPAATVAGLAARQDHGSIGHGSIGFHSSLQKYSAHQLRQFPQLPRFHLKPQRLAIEHWLIEQRLIMQGTTNGIGSRFFRILGRRGNHNKFRGGYFVCRSKILLLFPNDL
jgi:hypothetical protein